MFLQSITAVNGEESKELDTNPPILTDVTEKNKEAELYSEYFMPVNEYKPSIGEYKKSPAGPSPVKILCWVLSLLLLAGAIVLAVLIGSKSLFTPTWYILISIKLYFFRRIYSANTEIYSWKYAVFPGIFPGI